MNFRFTKIKYILTAVAGLILISCNPTKYVFNDEYLLNKVKIQADTKEIPKDDIYLFLRQTPNTRMLGLVRTQLAIYNWAGSDTAKWFNRVRKKIGEEPVIFNQQLTDISEKEIQKQFVNKGFMNAEVKSEVTYPKPKMANVKYIITSNKPYYLRGYTVNINKEDLYNIASDTAESLIKTDKLFDSDKFEAERERITKKFRDLGYYNFLKENLHFYADSALNSHQVDLVLELSSNAKDTLNNPVFQRFTVNKINYYCEADKIFYLPENHFNIDTVTVGHYGFMYEKSHNFRPNLLIEATHLIPGKTYSDEAVEKTYSSLNSLSSLKYMNINFQQVDSDKLDCNFTLTPNKIQSMSADIEGTYSSGYLGVGTNVTYGHRNLFHGSESLTAKGRLAYEYQGSGQNAIELGADLGLKFPTFLFPFTNIDLKRKIRANTQFNTTFSYRNRPGEYTGVVFGGGLKYNWSELTNIKHSFDLIDLSYVRYPWISQLYKDSIINKNPLFKYNFQNHFIMRMGYDGSYTNFNPEKPLKNYTSMVYGVETAGNLLYSLNKLFHGTPVQDSIYTYYTLFKIRFSQYVKFDYNISHHQIFNQNNRIVYHAGIGLAIPYGNANVIPFEKRYFAGGANSVRGWTAYQLGPGTYSNPTKNYIDFNTQMGDVKIDLNMEYRGKIFWKLDGALFLDAGNVWTIKDYTGQEGGAFKFNTFLNQFGVAYGAGLRLDFSYFVLRLDTGIRLYNPALNRIERWRIPFTKDDVAFNLAIGYPF